MTEDMSANQSSKWGARRSEQAAARNFTQYTEYSTVRGIEHRMGLM